MTDAAALFEATVTNAGSASEIEELLVLMPRTPRYTLVRVQFVVHDGELRHVLARRAGGTRHVRLVNDKVSGFQLEATFGRKEVRTVRGTFCVLPSTAEGIARLVAVCRSDFWNKGVQRLLRQCYPGVSRIFLNQREFRRGLERLQLTLGERYRLMVQEVSMREQRDNTPGRSRVSGYDAGMRWTDRGVGDIFDEALERRQFFRSIAFRIETRAAGLPRWVTAASCRLYRNGQIHLDGLYSECAQALFPLLESAAADRVGLFSNRGIRQRAYDPAKPLEVTYRRDLFSDKDTVARFRNTMMAIPRSTKAVFHANPYLHMSIADFVDGSSFEVWILSPRRILVVPQAKASVAAISRLVAHIFSEFEEGEVGEYGGEQPAG
jgi:hypothetical protein